MGWLWAMSLPGLVVLLVVLAAVERMGKRKDTPMSAAGYEELDAFFGTGKRHELDQRNSSLMLREDEDDGAPPLMRVDLDAGKVIVNPPEPDR